VRSYQLSHELVRGTNRLTRLQECSSSDSLCKPATTFDYYDDFGFEDGRRVVIDCALNAEGCNGPDDIVNGINPYGYAVQSGGKDHLATATVVTTVDTGLVSFFDTLSMGFSIIAGPTAFAAAGSLIQGLGSTLGHVDNTFYPLDVQVGTYADYGTPENSYYHASYGITSFHSDCAMPGRQPLAASPLDPDPTVGLFDVCPITIETTRMVPRVPTASNKATSVRQRIVVTPRLWYVDVDGDGLQDQLVCASLRDNSDATHITIARATRSGGDVQIPGQHAAPNANPVAAFSDMCQISCHNDDAVCKAFQGFTTTLDVNGDGINELVAGDSKDHLAALIFEKDNEGNLIGTWHDEYFSGVTLSPSKRDYVVTLDANGDGLRDLVGLPDPKVDSSGIGRIAYNTGAGFREVQVGADDNTALFAPKYASFVTDYDHDGFDDLLEPVSAASRIWRIRRFKDGHPTWEALPSIETGPGTLGDFDGDGNLDLLTGSTDYSIGNFRLFRGRGRRDHLLKKITDGMGRFVDIDYDSDRKVTQPAENHWSMLSIDDATLYPSTSWQPSWPVRVVRHKNIGHALVTSHSEGHYTSQARDPNQFAQRDRVVDYDYGDWAEDIAGYGPLGFDARLMVEADGQGVERSRRLIEFNLTQPDTSGPYTRPLTGLPVKVTELSARVETTATTNGHSPRTETTLTWQLGQSDAGLSFPFLQQKYRETGVDASHGADPSVTVWALATRTETSAVDQFGNVIHTEVSGDDVARTIVDRDFTPLGNNYENWLISLENWQDTTSWPPYCAPGGCDDQMRHRHQDFTYYPGTDLLWAVHRAPGDQHLDRTTTLGRSDTGNVNQVVVTDLNGFRHEVDIAFDSGPLFPTAITRVGGGSRQTTEVRYDDRFGSMTTRVDPNGIDETWSYDDFGVMRLSHGPNGDGSVDYAPDDFYGMSQLAISIPANYQIRASQAGGETTLSEYNALGQLVRVQMTGLADVAVSEEREYDNRNRLSQVFRPHAEGSDQGSSMYGYDAIDRLTDLYESRSAANGGAAFADTQIFYGLSNHTYAGFYEMGGFKSVRVVPPEGPITTKSFDAEGRLITAFDSEGVDNDQTDIPVSTRYVYAAFGELDRIETSEGDPDPLILTRDDYGRITGTYEPYRGSEVSSVVYNGLDEPTHTRDHAGRERDLSYDDFGRLSDALDDDGPTHWTYDVDLTGGSRDAIGRLVQTTSPTGQTVDYGYMAPEAGKNRGLLARITEHLTGAARSNGAPETLDLSLDYTYDDFSRLTRIDYPAVEGTRFAVEYGFDSAGHVISASKPGDPSATYWQLVDSDQGIRIKSERLGTAPCGTPGILTTREFDSHTGQLNDVQSACGNAVVQHLSYQYNDNNDTVYRSDQIASRAESFTYDGAGRLEKINGDVAVRYAQNRHGIGYQAGVGDYGEQSGGPDQLANIYWVGSAGADNQYHHNNAGDQYVRSGSAVHGGAQNIEYTTFDLPSHILEGTGYAADFTYDASGTRVTKDTNTSLVPGDITFYVGDLFQRIEHPTGPATNRNMIYAGGRLIAIATTTGSDSAHPTIHYLHDDALGSIQTITSDSGTVEATRDFGVYGVERGGQALFNEVPYGFTGHEHDADFGLINMKGRIYDPVLGEFLSPDPYMPTPMGHGLNAFAYVNNRPLDAVDPSGFDAMDNDEQLTIAMGAFTAGIIGGPACVAGCGAVISSMGSFFSSAGSAIADVPGAVASALGPGAVGVGTIGLEAVQIFLRTPNPEKAQGVQMNRGPQSAGSTTPKPSPNNPGQPTGIESGRSAIQMPEHFPNDCTRNPGMCLAQVPPDMPPEEEDAEADITEGPILREENVPVPLPPLAPPEAVPPPGESFRIDGRIYPLCKEPTVLEEYVNLASPERTEHILRGDATGGGHKWPGLPGKTPFPENWSDEEIMHNISDVATDPSLPSVQQTGRPGSLYTRSGAPSRSFVIGTRGGLRIRVVIEPAGEGIITAHPE
jgi:RHS repeat-associated protein